MRDAYEIYGAWCLSTGRKVPPRDWWDMVIRHQVQQYLDDALQGIEEELCAESPQKPPSSTE